MEAQVSARAARRILVFAFALITVYFTGFFPPGDNPNELSRIQAIVAFVESGTFAIDEPLRRFGNQDDKSASGGRYYSNKAPGLIFAGIPVYRLLRQVFPQPARGTAPVFVLVRLLTVSLASVIAVARFARRLEKSPGGERTAALVAFAVAFGTPFLYYARSFFSHAWTAALLFLSWEVIRHAEERAGGGRTSGARLAFAGLLAGWATISEYPVAPIGLLLAWRAFSAAGARGFLLFSAGAAPAFLLLLAYDAACFGSPFTLSSSREASPEYSQLARRGVFGIGLPDPLTALRLLLHPARGLVLFSPFWIGFIPGIMRWWRSGRDRKDCVFVLLAVSILFLSMAAYPHWEGGWSLGARYLVPAFFFAGLALPHALETPRSRGLFLFAAVFSAANLFLLSSAFPHIPLAIWWPAANLSAFLIEAGVVAPNLGMHAGLSPVASLLVPLAAVAAALAAAALAAGRTVPRRVVAVTSALLVLGISLGRPPSLAKWDDDWRHELRKHLLEALRRPGTRTPPL